MAESTIGFDADTGLAEAAWANLSVFTGNRLPIVSQAASKQVVAGATSMTVDVQNGISAASGVRHDITTVTNLTIAPVTLAGASRWDAVVLRYDWSTNTGSLLVVPGTASVGAPEVAPTLNSTPGVRYDQILALVKATNGSTSLTIRDKRLWGSPSYTASTVAALPPAAGVPYGTSVYVVDTKTLYRCLLSSGSLTWQAEAPANVVLTGTQVISAAPNWSLTQSSGGSVLLPCRGMYNAASGMVQVDLQMRRNASTISPFSNPGGVPVAPVGTLAATLRPDADVVPMPFTGQYTTSGGSANSWRNISLTVNALGVITLHQISAEDLEATSSGVSIRAHLTFFKRT